MSQAEIRLATVCDCKTSWLLYSAHMCIQYRRSLQYRADQSAQYGMDHLYFMQVVNFCTTLCESPSHSLELVPILAVFG